MVQSLLEAGAIAMGKTNLDQFATGLVGTRSPFGVPVNPIDARLVPGGSSSGSAVAGVLETGGDVVLVDGPGLAKRVAEATDGARIRLGIDAVGSQSTDHLAASLTDGGMLVNYGAMSGEPCQISPASLVFRNITLRGFWLSKWFIGATPEQRMKVFGEVAKLIASGVLKSRIQATYSIDQIKDAVGAAAAGERDGKILIVP